MQPLLVGGRRGAALYIRPDMAALGPEIATRARRDALLRDSIVYLTCLHELGHALGLDHTSDFNDIMYSFGFGGNIVAYFNRYRSQVGGRTDIARISGLSDADVMRIRRLYSLPPTPP
jgi:predicted Zn-dependent protease